jgi:hypothetical protein
LAFDQYRVFVLSQHPGADHPRAVAYPGQRDLQPLEAGRKGARAHLLDRGVEEQVGCRRPEPAADDDVLGLEDVHQARHRDAEPPAQIGQVPLGRRIAGPRALLDLLAGHAGGALEGAAGAVGLDVAAVRAGPARAGWPVGLDDHVAELGAEAGGAAEHRPVDDHASADAGAEREHDQVTRRASVHELGLGDRRAVAVVVDVDRDVEAPLELVAQRDALERDVHARDDGAGGEVDLRRHAHPDCLRPPVRFDRLAGELLEAVEQCVGVRQRGLDPLRRTRFAVDERGDLDLGTADIDPENLHPIGNATRVERFGAGNLLENRSWTGGSPSETCARP